MSRVDPITQALLSGVTEKVFPGAVLLVRKKGEVLYHQAVGRLGVDPASPETHTETIYDLASLTKPLATVTAIACLVQDRKLDVHQTAGEWLRALTDTPIGQVTLQQLLGHRAGLPAWRPYFETVVPSRKSPENGRDQEARKHQFLKLIGEETLVHSSQGHSVYSDLGFMLLGWIIEECTGQTLSDFCRERIYEPLEINPLFWFNHKGQVTGGNHPGGPVAPTEEDPWRGRLIHQEVHDENAYALGGIAGHAGLFGTGWAVSALGEMWLGSIVGRSTCVKSSLAQEFVTCPKPDTQNSWALGWDTPSMPSSSGSKCSPSAFGHLGYTGTSIWMDPVQDVQVVLLSNRVNPTRENVTIKSFRPMVHDVIAAELFD